MTTLTNSEAIAYLRGMLLIRKFEEASSVLYMQGRIKGFLHLCIGQEAVAIGAILPSRDTDYVISHYRDHGHALAKSIEPRSIMAELLGKTTGVCGGRGGSMHLIDKSANFMGGYGIVGGHLPIAVGMGLAIKYTGGDRVVLCFLGDGAANQGEFHESMNLAALWKLPILFILENNLYGMGSHIDRTHSGGRDIYLSAEGYKMPAGQIDGMDVMDVRNSATEALKRIRNGSGPIFLEAMTYRFSGHSMADPGNYRNRSEVEDWKTYDPIARFTARCLDQGCATRKQVDNVKSEVRALVEDSVRFAIDSPEPSPDTIYDYVYHLV